MFQTTALVNLSLSCLYLYYMSVSLFFISNISKVNYSIILLTNFGVSFDTRFPIQFYGPKNTSASDDRSLWPPLGFDLLDQFSLLRALWFNQSVHFS